MGKIEPDFYGKFVKTKVGKFELLPFTYNPPSGAQKCIYYSSVDLPKSIYIRGHYCSIERAGLGERSLLRTLSTIEHPALLEPSNKKSEESEQTVVTSKVSEETKSSKSFNQRIEYFVNESVPVADDVGYGTAISYTISTKTFSRLPKVTWASAGSKRWGRGEWLFYGREDETKPRIGVGITHKLRDNTYRVSLEQSIKRLKYFKKKPVKFTGQTAELDTPIGVFDIGFFKTVINAVDKNCIGFLAREINPAVFIRGYYCGGRTGLPEVATLKDILSSVKSKRFGFNVQ